MLIRPADARAVPLRKGAVLAAVPGAVVEPAAFRHQAARRRAGGGSHARDFRDAALPGLQEGAARVRACASREGRYAAGRSKGATDAPTERDTGRYRGA